MKSTIIHWSCLLVLLSSLSGCGDAQRQRVASDEGGEARPVYGGEATVLLGADFAGAWPTGLDPATSTTGSANVSLMTSIYGGLFQLTADQDGSNAKTTGVLAERFELSDDGKKFVIHIREGVKFSDGTPFDAAAVSYGIGRALSSSCTCKPRNWPWLESEPVSVADNHTVVLNFSRPYPAVVSAFPAMNINWIPSPSALKELGEDQFRITPVGAGPFKIVSNQLSTRLVLQRNPLYFQKGRPYLDRLTFQTIAGDQAAYQAILSGDAQAFEGMQSPLLIEQAKKNPNVVVTQQLATSPMLIQLNTAVPPFNDQEAREAIYYATNVEAIRRGLFKDWYPVSQSFMAPGGLFHHDKVDGYRAFDLEKARALVAKRGGLKVTLGTLRQNVSEQIITALQSQWKDAGIDTTIETYDLGNLIAKFREKSWHALLQTAGSYDPEAGSGLANRFRSGSVYSGVSDPTLDRMIAEAAETVNIAERSRRYEQIARYLSDKAYGPFLIAQAPAQISSDLRGPGLTTRIPALAINTAVLWQDVWRIPAISQSSR